jgi:hypothetical protein
MALEALLAVYPDADIIQTHRDPLKVLPSCSSLAQVLRAPFTNRFHREGLGMEVTLRWEGSARLALELRRSSREMEKRFLDVRYPDLMREPMAVVRGIYRHFSRELTVEAEAAMERFVAENPKDKHGVHRYTLEEFGLDRETERNRFRFYTEQYGIEPEP